MDKNPLISKLNNSVPGAVLETRRFGRSGVASVWIEAQTIQKVAEALKSDSELKLDWLENLSVVEFENVFVVSYFIRSTASQHQYILRASVLPPSSNAEIPFLSVCETWPMAEPFEKEAEEMFGIKFQNHGDSSARPTAGRLPQGWKGFPLRKNYEFPKEFFGIKHSRPFNSSNQKKPTQ